MKILRLHFFCVKASDQMHKCIQKIVLTVATPQNLQSESVLECVRTVRQHKVHIVLIMRIIMQI